jgi:hypothetical protein
MQVKLGRYCPGEAFLTSKNESMQQLGIENAEPEVRSFAGPILNATGHDVCRDPRSNSKGTSNTIS